MTAGRSLVAPAAWPQMQSSPQMSAPTPAPRPLSCLERPRAAHAPTLALAALLLFFLSFSPSRAHACGAAYPGGPVMCDFPRDSPANVAARAAAARPPIVRLAASYSFTSTTLLFGEGRRADLTRHAVLGSAQIPLNRTGAVSLLIGAGGVAGGTLVHGAARDTIGPGFAAFSGVALRVVDGRGAAPFVQFTGTLSATHALTRTDDRGTRTDGTTSAGALPDSPRFTAFDLRVGGVVGKTFFDTVTPYATARVFGGPISWRFDGADVTGTDLYKYQLGGGASVALLDRRLDLFVEGIALGERGVRAGGGSTFF